MSLYRNLGFTEMGLIIGFIFFYLLYLYRVYTVTQKLKNNSFGAVITKLTIRTLYFSLMIFALLAPSFGEVKKEIKTVGKDIYFAVDLSLSMDAIDIQPSRLEKLKFELKKITNAFSSDRLGLIVFSSDAFLQCPLTFDNAATNLFVNSLNTGLVSNAGTDFAPPLQMALKRLDIPDDKKSVKKNAKIIILISDGEDFGEETEAVANEIKEAGIKLFTLGIGTKKGGKIPKGYQFKRDKVDNDVITKLDAKPLRKLSDLTDGKYFEVSDKKNDISRLISAINSIEGELRNTKKVDVSANKYHYFLFVAFILIVIDVLLTLKVIKL